MHVEAYISSVAVLSRSEGCDTSSRTLQKRSVCWIGGLFTICSKTVAKMTTNCAFLRESWRLTNDSRLLQDWELRFRRLEHATIACRREKLRGQPSDAICIRTRRARAFHVSDHVMRLTLLEPVASELV